jgi:hypothetical protein
MRISRTIFSVRANRRDGKTDRRIVEVVIVERNNAACVVDEALERPHHDGALLVPLVSVR